MLWIIGLVMLWFRPSWGFLGIFALGIAVLSALGSCVAILNAPEMEGAPLAVTLLTVALAVAIDVGIFAILGAIVVALRGGKIEKKVSEQELDAELARVRAEIATREPSVPPGA